MITQVILNDHPGDIKLSPMEGPINTSIGKQRFHQYQV